ncbi:protein kinase domain-containing protein [Streptomyces hainanensis]|uniref:Serine/threonine protein kinase n=1 Tax=Streptomyces hainanensis TaxID=402648 RepID=A0A4R4TVP4_9ACTN|nr:protein kinase [Streptomyces hainanensis]TDC80104.1 serine/threonine protein kinase [Streptomyces hainanensis]
MTDPEGSAADGGPRGPGEPRQPPPPTEYEPTVAAPGGVPATETETGTTTGGGRGDTSRLPPPLRARFRLRELLRRPERPDQAAVYRVRDDAGSHVVKWYDRGRAPHPRVRELLRTRQLPHVVRLTETGRIDGHPYEIAPSYGDTDLARYRLDHPGPADPVVVRAVVTQLHAALTAVHRLGIVHRDVSPANIVLGSLDPADPELTLVDFSVAAYAPEERLADRDAWVGTPLYLSPQAVARRQMIHPQADWWALGMITAELAGGRHPIRHSHSGYVDLELSSGPPDLSLVEDPRLRALCRGLLTRDPDLRWGSAQVAEWLAGGAPPVAPADWPSPAPPEGADVTPFPFMGQEFTDPVRLGMAFDGYWAQLERALAHGRGRGAFADWLRQFAAAPRYDEAAREELAALVGLLGRRPGPAVLVRLLSWLAPPLEPSYRGEPVDPAHGLADLAARAVHDERAFAVVEELARHEILPLLATRPGGEGLAAIHRDWGAARQRWRPTVDALCAEFPALRRRLRDHPALTAVEGPLLPQLLHIAAAPERCRALLAEQASRRLRSLPEPVDWYGWLTSDRRDPLRLLLAERLAGLADEDAQRLRVHRNLEREARRLDAAAAWLTVQELPATLAWAVGGALAVTVPWIFLVGLADVVSLAPQTTVATAWSYAVPAAAATLALELWAAHRIGYLFYHPERSLAGLVIHQAGRAARPVLRHRVLGTVAVAAVVGLLLATLLLAAWLWPLGTVLAVAWWTWRRHRTSPARRPGAPLGRPLGPPLGDRRDSPTGETP